MKPSGEDTKKRVCYRPWRGLWWGCEDILVALPVCAQNMPAERQNIMFNVWRTSGFRAVNFSGFAESEFNYMQILCTVAAAACFVVEKELNGFRRKYEDMNMKIWRFETDRHWMTCLFLISIGEIWTKPFGNLCLIPRRPEKKEYFLTCMFAQV